MTAYLAASSQRTEWKETDMSRSETSSTTDHDQPIRNADDEIADNIGSLNGGAPAKHSSAIGAMAVGALAIGAVAIGALAIGRLAIKSARIRRLEIDELVVRKQTDPS
ncbi:hypothetical protein [Roseitalea porphyridii]|jgi:hypothetical protein|uniref:hypothetical protein n=2 Tax=Roseitalea porphyridii TaxID=1852022 RepID=UPI0032ED2745